MERRLVILAALVPVLALGVSRIPGLGLLASLALPMATIAWALARSPRAWALAMMPGVAVVAVFATEGLPAFLAAVLAGPIVARAITRGRGVLEALVWGAVPFAVWTIVVAASGFDPFPEEARAGLEEIWLERFADSELPPEVRADWKASAEAAVAILRQTWVGSEAVSFWLTLLVGYALARRLFREGGFPSFGSFPRLDLPDALVGGLIAGLAMVLIGGVSGLPIARTVGWNVIVVTGFAFVTRGLAIEVFWLDRTEIRRGVRVAAFAAAVLLAFPAFLVVTAGLGLFDTWFDFRKIRGVEEGTDSRATI